MSRPVDLVLIGAIGLPQCPEEDIVQDTRQEEECPEGAAARNMYNLYLHGHNVTVVEQKVPSGALTLELL